MTNLMKFLMNEDGNAAFDWIVLTAGALSLGIAVVASIAGGATEYASAPAPATETAQLGNS